MLKRITIAILLLGLLISIIVGWLTYSSPLVTHVQDTETAMPSPVWPVQSDASPPYLLLSMYANSADMERLFIQCGNKTVRRYQIEYPMESFDRVLTIFSEFTPPVGEKCTASFYNRSGMFVQSRIPQTMLRTPTGSDHPGGKNAAGNMPYPPSDTRLILPDGGRSASQVALLNTGFVYAAARLLLIELGEPVRIISPQFDPFSLVEQLPVLLIPSDGLEMLQDSISFRARLETYTRQGGTIIVLAQPHGHAYNLLPGGQVSGSGWQEDEGFLSVPVTIGNNHASLVGFEQTGFSAHSRGFLTGSPSDSQILLKRIDNRPVALTYPYYQGHVVATTLYEDWSCATGQCSPQTHVFLRELLSWAIAPTNIPATVHGEEITLTLPVTNTSRYSADGVRLSLISPERTIVQQQVLSTSLEPGASTGLTFNTFVSAPPGIWRVDATMVRNGPLDGIYWPVAPRTSITYFLATDPMKIPYAPTSIPKIPPKINLNITPTLDKSVYMPGDIARLALAVTTNETVTDGLSVRLKYGDFEIVQPLEFENQKEHTITFTIPTAVEQGDILSYGIYDAVGNGLYLNTSRLYFKHPLEKLSVYPDKPVYASGETIQITLATTQTGVVRVQAPDYSHTLTMTGQITTITFTAPPSRGQYPITAALDDGSYRSPARSQTYFTVTAPWVRVIAAELIGLPYAPGDKVEADVTVDSTESIETILQTWLNYPDGTRGDVSEHPVSIEAGTNILTITMPLSTTQTGSHLLVYRLVDFKQTDHIYSTASRAFDVGTAMLLGITTPPHQAFRGAPIQAIPVSAGIFAATETQANLTWYLDEQLITTQNLSLINGTQTISVTLPHPASPGWHTVRADLTAKGLSSRATTDFAWQTFGPDIVVKPPELYRPSGYTATVYTYLYNMGDRQTQTTTVKFYDGNPAEGGELIGKATVPPLPPKKPYYNHTEEIFLPWNVRGKAGYHTLYAVADADNNVAEIDEDNNIVKAEGAVPRLSLTISSDKESYRRGEPVIATGGIINLQSADNLTLDLALTVDLLGFKPLQVTKTVTVPPGAWEEGQYVWQDTDTRGGTYNLVFEAQTNDGHTYREGTHFSLPYSAQFTAEPLRGTAPLTVTFTDLSTPWGRVDSWQWDFGDGSVSDESDPVHVFNKPGLYTVALTSTILTVPDSEFQQKIIEQGCFAKQASDGTFIFTVTHPITVTVPEQPHE